MVPEEYTYSSLKDLPMINLRSYNYKNIKNNSLYVDELVQVWKRTYVNVEANSEKDAVNI